MIIVRTVRRWLSDLWYRWVFKDELEQREIQSDAIKHGVGPWSSMDE